MIKSRDKIRWIAHVERQLLFMQQEAEVHGFNLEHDAAVVIYDMSRHSCMQVLDTIMLTHMDISSDITKQSVCDTMMWVWFD